MSLTFIKRIALCVICFVVSYYLAILLHEYAHSFTAYLLGGRSNPLAIDYGHYGILYRVDEANHYDHMMAQGKHLVVGISGIAGLIMSWLLVMLAIRLCRNSGTNHSSLGMVFSFWLGTLSLVSVIGYIPFGSFEKTGDIGRFCQGLNIPHTLVYLIALPLVLLTVYFWMKHCISAMNRYLGLNSRIARLLFRALCLLIPLMLMPTLWMLINQDFNHLLVFDSSMPMRYLMFISALLVGELIDKQPAKRMAATAP
ncbi:hypothetical protein [Dongshaea marina]|uniref:hypothetical protein n=1 Tax=Dongshaea marina TaxID=2047966 RepID=UPI000D3E72C8|nr:hypothetical protein [Dongshaea marina]